VDNFYLAYGLTFLSDCSLPGVQQCAPTDQAADVRLWFTEEPAWVREARRLDRRLLCALPQRPTADPLLRFFTYGEEEFFEFAYADESKFLLDAAGTRVWASCAPPLVIEDLLTYFVGPVLGFLLRRRGMIPLHACTMELEGSVIALCGPGGAGKSTTAAALALRGIPILCEDVSPLARTGSDFRVPPGYPRVCLWPESARILTGLPETLPKITPTWEKRYLALDGKTAAFASSPGTLSAVYFLEPRTAGSNVPRIEEIKPADGLVELVKNSYMSALLNKEQRAAEFDVFGCLAESVVLRKIKPHSAEAKLSALCDLILEDASRLCSERQRVAERAQV